MLVINKLIIQIEYQDNSGEIKIISPKMKFNKGLNFIWDKGKNSVGKSTCINSIFYGIGLEELLGAKGGNTMKPVLNRKVKIDNNEFNVYETYIILEISNGIDCVTVKRSVKGVEYDTKLVKVYNSDVENMCRHVKVNDYYLHDNGAAQREIGFHKFLEKFMMIELPVVSYNNDKSGKLYLQAIANMFFIEQVRGWTGFNIQKIYYGIKNVEKISIEYLLGCTVTDIDEKKNNLNNKLRDEKEKITAIKGRIMETLLSIGDEVKGIEYNIKDFNIENINNIRIDGKSINSIKKQVINELDFINSLNNKTIKYNENIISEDLKLSENELINYERKVEIIKQEYSVQLIYRNGLQDQLKDIELKIRRYEDIIKLRKLGSNAQFNFLNSKCPLCDHKMQESLLPNEINVRIMKNEDNLSFIKGEKRIIEIAIEECNKLIIELKEHIIKYEQEMDSLRSRIRMAKRDLISLDSLPSENLYEKKYYYKEKLNNICNVENKIEAYYLELYNACNNIKLLEKNKKELKGVTLTDVDQKKIYKFQTNFRKLLKEFGYTSTDIESIKLSQDKYLPISDGFHLIYDSAGSDFVRAVWAYLLSLYVTSNEVNGNHPGIFVLDEPFQQQVSEVSISKFVSEVLKLNSQFIIATSIPIELMNSIYKDNINVITIEENFLEL